MGGDNDEERRLPTTVQATPLRVLRDGVDGFGRFGVASVGVRVEGVHRWLSAFVLDRSSPSVAPAFAFVAVKRKRV